MPLFGTRDEGEDRFKKAKHYSDPSKKDFDLDTAIRPPNVKIGKAKRTPF